MSADNWSVRVPHNDAILIVQRLAWAGVRFQFRMDTFANDNQAIITAWQVDGSSVNARNHLASAFRDVSGKVASFEGGT